MATLIDVYIDGACEPKNPGGHASYGVYVVEGDRVLTEEWGIIGDGPKMSNNVAEYEALFQALQWLEKNTDYKNKEVRIHTDSQLVAQQMSKQWEIRASGGLYTQYAQKCFQYLTKFPSLVFQWIPREKNEFADGLSKRALKEIGIEPRIY